MDKVGIELTSSWIFLILSFFDLHYTFCLAFKKLLFMSISKRKLGLILCPDKGDGECKNILDHDHDERKEFAVAATSALPMSLLLLHNSAGTVVKILKGE